MTEQQQDEDVSKTATLTVRGIPSDVRGTIFKQAERAGLSVSEFLSGFLIQEFQDLIKEFSRTSELVGLMDGELVRHAGNKLAEHWYDNDFIAETNKRYRALLQLNSHDDLQQLMMRNMPYLKFRSDQVSREGYIYYPRGISLTFSLFNEIASRDAGTIHEAYRQIFWLVGATKYYGDINGVRAQMKLAPVEAP